MKIIIDVDEAYCPVDKDLLVYNKKLKKWEVKQKSVFFTEELKRIKSVEDINASTCAKMVEFMLEVNKKLATMSDAIKTYIK